MRDYISAFDIANEIRMTRSQFKGTFLVVEGEKSDLILFSRFTNSDQCQLIPAHSKNNAIKVINILENEKFVGLLGIIDADFMNIENQICPGDNLFLTDTHDLETMILQSPALDKLISEYCSQTKIKNIITERGADLRTILLDLVAPWVIFDLSH